MRIHTVFFFVVTSALVASSTQAMELFVTDKAIVESGHDLFNRHCARCHSKEATGGTVDTGKETQHAPDLTRLAERNGGTIPVWGVYEIVSGSKVISEHKPRTMPLWGKEFAKIRGVTPENKESMVRGRIMAILAYLSTIQKK